MPKFDPQGDPRIDFFQWVNGPWLEENPMPAHKSQWGKFNVLHIQTQEKVRTLIENLQTKPDSELDVEARQVRDFYASGMNMKLRNEEGFTSIEPLLRRVSQVNSLSEAIEVLPDLHKMGTDPFWFADSSDDMKDNTKMALWLYASGIGLPDRDYYFDEDKAKIRKEYVGHIERMFKLIGWTKVKAKSAATSIMKLETALASAMLTRAELRDPNRIYNPMPITQLVSITPSVDWSKYFASIGAASSQIVVVEQPAFFERLNTLLAELTPEQIGQYYAWNILDRMAPRLSEPFIAESFAFNGAILSGKKENEPLWERVLGTVGGSFGEVIGRLYAEHYFNESAKQKMQDMINQIVDVFELRIRNLDWLGEETKVKALAKLKNITWKIGYPDKWRDYSRVGIQSDSFATNFIRGRQFIFHRELAKLGQPVDKSEWQMSANTVNAYADPVRLDMCYPAGILQAPFFDTEADDATNYGAIFAVIGHELTHPNDDEGSKFDENGELNDWWSDEDRAGFEVLVSGVREQYSAIEILPGAFINGQLTLGENAADFGGISLAYEAMRNAYADRDTEIIDGLTPEQRFFIGWARVWGSSTRDEELRRRLTTDPHSPDKQRCNIPLSNMPEFYEAFNVKEGDAMWRPAEARAKVW